MGLITSHPVDVNATAGNNATFSVAATGDGTLSYQWQKNTANIDGVTNATYSLTNVQDPNSGTYRCIVTHAHGTMISNNARPHR